MTTNIEKITDSIESIGIEGISIIFGKKECIGRSNLQLLMGKKYGICGRNGSGKTSLLKLLNSQLKHSIYIDQYIPQEQWKNINIVEAILQANVERNELMEKLQDLDDLEFHQTSIGNLDIDRDEAEIKKILHGLGFQNHQMNQTYYDFSGGWKTRISLARALYLRPRILFLDEPTNHLDLEAIVWLENYLTSYKGILLLVSHNIHFLDQVCTDILHLYMSDIRHYSGNYKKFQKQFHNDQLVMEKNYEKFQKELKHLRAKGRIKEAQELLKKDVPRPEKPYRIKMDFDMETDVRNPLVQLENVTFGYGDLILLENIDLSMDKGTKITIVGLNGCGKTTLFKLIMNQIEPQSGTIWRNEKARISYFHQHSIEELPEDCTPIEYLEKKYNFPMESIRKILGSISLESIYHSQKIKILSGGQRMRIVFSEILIQKPHLILFDEPTNHLDMETIECFIESINHYQGAILLITHDIHVIEETNCLVYHLHEKRLTCLENGMETYMKIIFSLRD